MAAVFGIVNAGADAHDRSSARCADAGIRICSWKRNSRRPDPQFFDALCRGCTVDKIAMGEAGDTPGRWRQGMAYLVVPHEVSASTATIWVGAIDEPFDPSQVRLISNRGDHPLPLAWEHWAAEEGAHHLDYQRVTIAGLQPSSPMALQLLVNGQPQADA